ncbi:hypothetical protein BGX38DRAFT_1091927, partial [Terfezia claveryi]
AFDYVWHRLPPYTGFSVPSKAYHVVSQWSGKEMQNFGKVILGTFIAALHHNADQGRPTGAQIQEFNKAIRCVRSITDFYLITQYESHMDETISYLEKYLCVFHGTKNVFLCFRTGKEGSHYNFPKIHLISHYAEQIPKFGTLGQYSTEISETMHKAFKDTYCRSNRVNAIL